MNKPKHTPGPWFIEYDTDTIRHGEQSADGLNKNSKEVDVFGSEEGIANARLIAVAPELLEALKNIVIRLGDVNLVTTNKRNQKIHNDIIKEALQAVAKAEGKE